jgi:hypothetical protein
LFGSTNSSPLGRKVGRSHQLLRRCDHDDFTGLLIRVVLSQGQFSVDPAW